ncbi:MAG: DUF938 domain-containing protein [Pseudomonadota bacterium]
MSGNPNLPSSAAAERNFAPLLAALRSEFAHCRQVLEIGSGTGQHAAGFAAAMPWLRWQPSEVPGRTAGIQRWKAASAVENLRDPIELDVLSEPGLAADYDAAFSANTAHIMSENGVERLFRLLGRALPEAGRFCLYGPFREAKQFSTESNARFDRELRSSDPQMGIRDLERVDEFARRAGMRRLRRYAMPGNNLLLVFGRDGKE